MWETLCLPSGWWEEKDDKENWAVSLVDPVNRTWFFFYLTRDLTKPKQVHQRDTGVARTKTRPLYQIAIFINLHQNVMEWIEIGVLTAQSGSIGGYYPLGPSLGKGMLQKPESRKLSVRGGTPPLRNFTPLSVCYFTLSV